MANVDSKLRSYYDRFRRLEAERREIAESIRDLVKEAKGVGMSPDEIAGIKLAVKRSFEPDERRAKREAAEDVADALGGFADSPLGAAAVKAAKPHHDFDGDDAPFDPGPALPFVAGNEYHAPH